jgi:acyl-CoA synthetase (AMP-forming)/AMP-acid ligase II
VAIGPKTAFPEHVLDAIDATRATGLYGVPSTYETLLSRSSIRERRFETLRFFAQAGGRLGDESIAALRDLPSQPQVFVMYGQTEATARLSVLPPARLADKLGSIGKGLADTELTVVGQDGLPVRPGEEGEIVARGPGITLGYLGDPEATARYFRDGALHTGDRATVDEDGFVYIRGRDREFLKVGGVRVHPTEIETVLARMPEIADAAVDGVPDRLLGEAPRAHLVLSHGASLAPAEVIARCRRELPAEKVPRLVLFHDALPRTPAGKVARARLSGP